MTTNIGYDDILNKPKQGDFKFINGRQLVFTDGEWVAENLSLHRDGLILIKNIVRQIREDLIDNQSVKAFLKVEWLSKTLDKEIK